MIAILHHHAPAQRCHRRRRQPSWWTPESQTGSICRNTRQVPQRFHRVVRRCQNQFWSDWQENLTSLSRVNPRAAASRVRQMFSGQSRRDHTPGGHISHPQNLPGQTLWSSGGNISFQHNLLVCSTRTSRTKSRGDSLHCSLST